MITQSNSESNWSKLSRKTAWKSVGIMIMIKTNNTPINLPPKIWSELKGFVIRSSKVPWENSSEKVRILIAGIKKRNKSEIKKFENLGSDIGLLFQVADDLIDHKGSLLTAGKKTGKDKKKGKATLISLLGHKNTIKYANKLILKINNKLKKYGSHSKNLSETLEYILNRNKWKKNTNTWKK